MCMRRNWDYRWRTSYHWWADSFDDKKWNRRVSNFQESRSKDQRKLKDVTKKVNAVIIHIEKDITQTKKIAMTAALWFAKEVGVKKAKK